MEMHEIYRGTFGSRDGATTYTVRLLREQRQAPSRIGLLSFCGREPLVIEWPVTAKEDVVCGSVATLRLLSPGDRTYAELYTVKAGSVVLEVLRDGALYWRGTLDPEQYEEPYCQLADYEVSLTFSDFGILERLKYNLGGSQTLMAVLASALERAQLGQLPVDTKLVSTTLPDGLKSLGLLNRLYVRSENFADEDGEVQTLREAVEGMLQPLGLRVVQRSGCVWVYDLNGLWQDGATQAVRWHDSDQVLGVDKVVNRVKITFSPYGSGKLLESEAKFQPWDEDGGTVHVYYPDLKEPAASGKWDAEDVSFELHTGPEGTGVTDASRGFFRVKPVYGGTACTGVVGSFSSTTVSNDGKTTWGKHYGRDVKSKDKEVMLRSHRVWVPDFWHDGLHKKYCLRLSLEMLVDARYNPWSTSEEGNQKGWQELLTGNWTFVYIPVGVTLYTSGTTYYWSNIAEAGSDLGAYNTLKSSMGFWARTDPDDPAPWGEAWLEWYDPQADLEHSSGIGGWQTNRHAVGMNDAVLRPAIKNRPAGQYLPVPPTSGELEVVVYGGLWPYHYGKTAGLTLGESRSEAIEKELTECPGLWHLYKAPVVELVDMSLTNETAETQDMEYSGVVNAHAKDDLELETICGTMADYLPTSLGLYRLFDGRVVTTLCRGGREGGAEELLIGTLHSQYAERHVKLTGTTELLCGGLQRYSEAMQGERVFLLAGDVQDLDAGTSEVTLVELSGDEYDATGG